MTFLQAKTYSVIGIPFDSHTLLNARSGWSMIGSTSYSSTVSLSVGTIKAVFKFTNKCEIIGSGSNVGNLESGKGYWIYLSDQADVMVAKE